MGNNDPWMSFDRLVHFFFFWSCYNCYHLNPFQGEDVTFIPNTLWIVGQRDKTLKTISNLHVKLRLISHLPGMRCQWPYLGLHCTECQTLNSVRLLLIDKV